MGTDVQDEEWKPKMEVAASVWGRKWGMEIRALDHG